MEEEHTALGLGANPSKSKIPTKDIGAWEKHTKGIGLKLLQKFGFKGRLGANENGVSRAVEVVVRPNNQGLGFGDLKEASSLKVNKKIEAEWKGEEFVDLEEEEKKKKRKSAVEQLASSQGWKKGKAKDKGPAPLSAKDFINKYMADPDVPQSEQKQVIVDMRHKDTRVITDMSALASEDFVEAIVEAQSIPEKPQLGEELLYNIHLVANNEEMNVTRDSRQLAQEVSRRKSIENDKQIVIQTLNKESKRLGNLEKILKILQRIEETVKETPEQVTVSSVCQLIQTLHESFQEEFQIFGLMNLLPNLVSRIIVTDGWDAFREHAYLYEIYESLSPLVAYFDQADQGHLARQASKAFYDIVEIKFLPVVRRTISSAWDVVHDPPQQCVHLMQSLQLVLPETTFTQTVDMLVMPKLTAAVAAWKPIKTATTLQSKNTGDDGGEKEEEAAAEMHIHTWLHPWLPLLTTKLSTLYPEIRRKFGAFFSTHWTPTAIADAEFALRCIRPWVGVFDATSMENLLVRSVVPKLARLLREGLTVHPQNQDIGPMQTLFAWVDVLPSLHMMCLLIGEFFPKWLRVLYQWLTAGASASRTTTSTSTSTGNGIHTADIDTTSSAVNAAAGPDYEEISTWYSGWKSFFPDPLQSEDHIVQSFNVALDMMQACLMVEADDPSADSLVHVLQPYDEIISKMEHSDYAAVLAHHKTVQRAERRLEAMQREEEEQKEAVLRQATAMGRGATSHQVTFKEVIATFALKHNVEFAPRIGKFFEGKQLWQFGSSLCFMENNVIFVSTNQKGAKRSNVGENEDYQQQQHQAGAKELYGWSPVALEDLLSMSQQ